MTEFIYEYELIIRIIAFTILFGIVAGWEILSPRRVLTVLKSLRWINNLGIVAINTVLLRFIFPAAAVGFAAYAETQGWGLFNNLKSHHLVPIIISVILLDAIIYFQHKIFHAIPMLWRIHRVHHADLDFDVTTGIRFHPIEIILSMFIKFVAIVILGPPVFAVIIFEILLNATSIFNHGNIQIPKQIDKLLRWFIVTPDMHRVHHSVELDETNSNFGFSLPWWDRLFGTYRDQPRESHELMTIGIKEHRDTRHCAMLPGMMILPFVQYTSNSNENNHNQIDTLK